MKNVLIAHQSTIPHYRVPFYNALERLRPDSWRFDVVFDPTQLESPRFFQETLDVKQFKFPILEVRTFACKARGKTISYQTLWRKAARYDLVVVENALNNLAYPLCHLHQLRGSKIAYWGHGKDRSVEKPSPYKLLSEELKMFLARRADGFFAYTAGVKSYLEQQGLSPRRMFVVNNTIDINEQRRAFRKWRSQRTGLRKELGLRGKKVLLFVGRFTQNKRLDFLLRSFAILCEMNTGFHLLLVGSRGEAYLPDDLDDVSYFGPIVEMERLAPLYVASDVFAFPGSVGLGPLQALCYDLPTITINSATHMPEIEYLSPANSIVLNDDVTPEEYARAIVDLFSDSDRLSSLQASIWPSIRHLTIEQMAQNFSEGVNSLLDL